MLRERKKPSSGHWAAQAKRWNEGERSQTLEDELYKISRINPGINFNEYSNISVHAKGTSAQPIQSFDDIDLSPMLLENIHFMNYTSPTPIQKYVLSIAESGQDILGCAQTGSGKTAAFVIPILNRLLTCEEFQQKKKRGVIRPFALILAPTRELATQIFDECRKFAYRTWIKPAVVYGGADAREMYYSMKEGSDILVATPGRLLSYLVKHQVSLEWCCYLVLDEADRMLDMNFEADLRRIMMLGNIPNHPERRTMMFSATFPKQIRPLAGDFLTRPATVTVGRVGNVPSTIKQTFVQVEKREKMKMLIDILTHGEPQRTLVFARTKVMVDTLDRVLAEKQFPVTSIHGDRSQEEREDALNAFKMNITPLMIATDVAARGLDIPNINHIINYDMPKNIEDYVHRIGRTARVGNEGRATSFFDPFDDELLAEKLVCLLKECKQPIPEFLTRDSESRDVLSDTSLDEEDFKGGDEIKRLYAENRERLEREGAYERYSSTKRDLKFGNDDENTRFGKNADREDNGNMGFAKNADREDDGWGSSKTEKTENVGWGSSKTENKDWGSSNISNQEEKNWASKDDNGWGKGW